MKNKDQRLLEEAYTTILLNAVKKLIKENENEVSLEDFDKMFNELAQELKQAGAPVVAQTIVEQMQAIREQLRKERDLENFQRLRLLMIKQIKELKEALQGDPELIKSYNTFLNTYVNSRGAQLDEAAGIKEQLETDITFMRLEWVNMMKHIGALARYYGGAANEPEDLEKEETDAAEMNALSQAVDPDSRYPIPEYANARSRGLINFIKNLEGRIQGYDWVDIQLPSGSLDKFIQWVGDVIKDGMKEAKNTLGDAKAEIYNHVDKLQEVLKQFVQTVTKTSKTLNTMRIMLEKNRLQLLGTTNQVS